MKDKNLLLSLLGMITAILLSSCVQTNPVASGPPKPNPNQTEIVKAIYVNPYPEGSYANFKARRDYKKTYNIWKNHSLLNSVSPSETKIVISLSKQRAVLYKGSEPIMDYPVATGTSSHPTPRGSFRITEKIKDKSSNLYGKVVNSSGSVVKSGASSRKDSALIAQSGNRFVGAPMPYWMRLTNDGIGMHQGKVPRYPASHGCIRTYYKAVPIVFSKVKVGTPVSITY